MICSDAERWRELAAHRFDPALPEPEGWAEALDHLEDCEGCRERALSADPTLLFRRLAAPLPQPEAGEDAAAMCRAVAAMRRAGRVERRLGSPIAMGAWSRWAAAVLVALTTLSLGVGSWLERSVSPMSPVSVSAVPRAAFYPATEGALDPALVEYVSTMPLVEWPDGVESEDAPMVLEGDDTALIWVLDPTLSLDV